MASHAKPRRRPHLATSPFPPPTEVEVAKFDVDDRVGHDRYGLGRVVEVEESVAVVVDFTGRRERILAPYYKLTKL